MIEIVDCIQGEPEWYLARLGLPTASEFHTVMAKGKDGGASITRAKYMRTLAGEILTGEPAESYTNAFMERGKALEDEARDMFAFMADADVQQVGFIKNAIAGCSPDSLIGDDSGLEIKVAVPHIQIERLLRGVLPAEHKAQVHGNMWVTGRRTWSFVSYCPKLPLFHIKVERDDDYIAGIAKSVAAFNVELQATVDAIRCYNMASAA